MLNVLANLGTKLYPGVDVCGVWILTLNESERAQICKSFPNIFTP